MSSRRSKIEPASFLRHFDQLLGQLNTTHTPTAVHVSGLTGWEDILATPADRPCAVSIHLLRTHVASVCLGLSSPLQFVVTLLRDVLLACPLAEGDSLLSHEMRTALKCSLMEILAVKATVDDMIATASRRFHEAEEVSINVSRVARDSLRNGCMSLLEGEELGASTERKDEALQGMDVWVAYMDAELAVGNHSRALKVGYTLALLMRTI